MCKYSAYIPFILLLFFSLVSCRSIPLDQATATISSAYVEIPKNAQNIHLERRSVGQWKAEYIMFAVNNNELDPFLSHTCFRNSQEIESQSSNFHLQGTSNEPIPTWWSPDFNNLILEGLCSQNGVNIGIGVIEEGSQKVIYLVSYVP